MATEETPSVELTANDRCDAGGEQAYHVAFKDDSELYFCNHHYLQHEERLLLDGWLVASDTSKLYPSLSATAPVPELTEQD